MTDLLDHGMAWLGSQRTSHMARLVTYVRGDAEIELSATVGRSSYDQPAESGVIQRVDGRDYLVSAADMASMGEPRARDRIIDGDDTWEVLPPTGSGEPAWRYSDQFRRTMRIHVKALEIAAP